MNVYIFNYGLANATSICLSLLLHSVTHAQTRYVKITNNLIGRLLQIFNIVTSRERVCVPLSVIVGLLTNLKGIMFSQVRNAR